MLFEFLGNKPITFIKSPQRDIRNKAAIKDTGLVKVSEDYMGMGNIKGFIHGLKYKTLALFL